MADNYIYRICPECGGDGVIDRSNVDADGAPVEANQNCENCQDGLVLWGVIKKELIGEE